jgi:uncharacterized RmlC-like cupin family protein
VQSIEVTRGTTLTKGSYTRGIARNVAFEADGVLLARSRIKGGVKSGWHHHGTRDLYGFVISGRLRLEYNGGNEVAEVRAGDFFHIPVGLVHRDVNLGREEAVVVNISLGQGPPVVNVEI